MASYSAQGYARPSEINVIPLQRVNQSTEATADNVMLASSEAEARVDPEMIRILIPKEQVVKSFEAPTEAILRRKIKSSRKSQLKRLKKLDYWIEGRHFCLFVD